MTATQLQMEMASKVLPAARDLIEALRVAGLTCSGDVSAEAKQVIEHLHGRAINLGELIADANV